MSASWFNHTFNFLNNTGRAELYPLFIVAQIIFSLCALARQLPYVSPLVVYFCTVNLQNRAAPILDGGGNLMQLMLFYSIFINPSQTIDSEKMQTREMLETCMSNCAIIAARIQLVLVYAVSGCMKLTGELWVKGVALYYALSVDEFTLPILKRLMMFPAVIVAGTYFTLIFQLRAETS